MGGVIITLWTLFLDEALKGEVQNLAPHLTDEHEKNLDFAGGPYQGGIDDTEGLRDESKPCAKIGDWVSWILEWV